MQAVLAEPRTMTEPDKPRGRGRPKGPEAASIRITAEVRDLARKAGYLRNETITEYVSRTVREAAERELIEDAKRTLAEAEARAKRDKGGPK